MCARTPNGVPEQPPVVSMTDTSTEPEAEIPFAQRLFNRIWLLAAAALLFFALSYVGWGLWDILTVPPR